MIVIDISESLAPVNLGLPELSTGKPLFAGTLELMESVADIPFVGGHLALDFVNTAEERGDPQAREFVCSPSDLLTWAKRQGLPVNEIELSPEADAELARALAAREVLHDVFLSRVAGRPPSAAALRELGSLAAAAEGAGTLVSSASGGLDWTWPATELSSLRHHVVTEAVRLLYGPPDGRLKRCPGERCGWFFLDATKRGNRRWCSMTECGQDAKTLRRRARRAPA
jgi:predicted RNA-binding Zn ribbon-like protein